MVAPAATGSGASVLVGWKRGSDRTVVVIAAPLVGGVSLQSMPKVPLVIVVLLAIGVLIDTTIWTEPDPPAARLPTFQVTTPAARVPPAVAETNVVLAGTVSVT